MRFLISLLSSTPYIVLPPDLLAWIGWFALSGIIVFLIWKLRFFNKHLGKNQRIIYLLLTASIPFTSLFIGIKLPEGTALPPPEVPLDPFGPVAMVFSALPWVLAAGLLGPTPAALIGLLTGIIRALWLTHNIYTPLEVTLLAILFAAAVCQKYRTPLFRLLSHPLVTASLLSFIYPFIYIGITLFTSRGILVSRLDYAQTLLLGTSIAMGVELIIAGMFAEVVALGVPTMWGGEGPLVPSPAERSLRARFLSNMAPLAIILVLALIVGIWKVAGNAAREMMQTSMINSAQIAAKNIPYFHQVGQNITTQLASDPRLQSLSPQDLSRLFEETNKNIPFFNQLVVIDQKGEVIAYYPNNDFTGLTTPVEEQIGIQHVLNGKVPFLSFTLPPSAEMSTAQVSFISAIKGEDQSVSRVLVGRSEIGTNPIAQPLSSSLLDVSEMDGQGLLLDEEGKILIHPDRDQVMTSYTGRKGKNPVFYDDTAPDGTRRLVYYQPADGHPWSIVLTVPAYRTQQLALTIAAPLLLMILLVSILAVFILNFGLGVITGSLQKLASQAELISQGELDNPLPSQGVDEVGQLRSAFETMRVGLKKRLDELNLLLKGSQGVASSLEITEAIHPVMKAALATGASSVRVILSPSVVPEVDADHTTPASYGSGPAQTKYRELDVQILEFIRQNNHIVLPNFERPRIFSLPPYKPHPSSLMAVPLRHENQYYGALWLAFDEPHEFSQEEVRFVFTIGGLAAMAVSNSRLYQNAEVGRQRLAAILASSPYPVLVTDQGNQLLLANPAAREVLGSGLETGEGLPIERVISHTELLQLMQSSSAEDQPKEITLDDGRVYHGTATSVITDGQRVGRVCILQDVTQFKELDTLKSEFVSTVSHDLRAPLTLMRGYATMLEMVGQLNDQQAIYVGKIVSGVEGMSRLVENLLDLGRIEAGVGLQLEKVSPSEVIDHVIEPFQLQALQKRIKLTPDITAQEIPLIEADQALLQQAIHNLVENAIKFNRTDGEVILRLEVQENSVTFSVIDDGIGISPMDQQHLFDKFYRVKIPGSEDRQGTGLGLKIVKSIADRHNGNIRVESRLGQGSTFSLEIPIRQPEREDRT